MGAPDVRAGRSARRVGRSCPAGDAHRPVAAAGGSLFRVSRGSLTILAVLTALLLTAPAAAEGLPACTIDDRPALITGYEDHALTVLDTVFALPSDYVPPDLVPVSRAFPPSYDGGGQHQVRAVVIDDLAALLSDAEAAGVRLAVQSAYRSYGYQERTFAYWVETDGYEAALASSARPGHSEHQLGTAIDLRSYGGPAAWDIEDWAKTPEGAWVAANAHLYGFVMSYPEGKRDVTCYVYEPWHYRYVGREMAAAIHASGLTPREYLWLAMRTELEDRAQAGGEAR